MNDTRALCPNCQNTVQFERVGEYNCCPVCGAKYQLAQWGRERKKHADSDTSFGELLRMFLKAILILASIVVVIIGIAFAGCLVLMSPH